MSMKVIPFRGRRAAPVRERTVRIDIKPHPPRAIVTWPEGLQARPCIYVVGDTDIQTEAVTRALEKALSGNLMRWEKK